MYVVTLEKCFVCGQPCTPAMYVVSQRRQRQLALCGKCAPKWLEEGEMPE